MLQAHACTPPISSMSHDCICTCDGSRLVDILPDAPAQIAGASWPCRHVVEPAVDHCCPSGLLCCCSRAQAVLSSLHVRVVTSSYNAGSPSAMVAAAGVMMTGAADVEAAAAMEVAASADALQAAGQQKTLLPTDWQAVLLWRPSYCFLVMLAREVKSKVHFLQVLTASVC